jgi:hypothetical protein
MALLQQIETTLDGLLGKKAPMQLPENARRTLANAMWWLAAIGGVLQLWAAWAFWQDAHRLNQIIDTVNMWGRVYGSDYTAPRLGVMFYVALVMLAIDGVILLLAVGGLKAHKKAGWNLLFYSMLLNAAYGIVRVFADYGGGTGSMFVSILISLVGAYFLFQIRDKFLGGASDTKKIDLPKQ